MKFFSLPKIVIACCMIAAYLPFQVQAQCINTFPYIQDFENGAGGWTSSSVTPNGTGPNSWQLADPINPIINSAASGVNAWITNNTPVNGFGYNNNEFSAVESPCFDFSNLLNPHIAVNIWWESEPGFDGTVLQASTDSGATWITIGDFLDPVAWYNNNSVSGGLNGGPGGQALGWSGTVADGNGSQGWIPAQHALNGLAGEPDVFLRFAFASDFSSNNDGFAFDDVVIADAPFIDLGQDTVICFNDTLFFDVCVPNGVSYQWSSSPVDTLCTKVVVNTNQYIVSVEDSLGFVVKDTIYVFVSPTNVDLPQDKLICPGDTFLIDAGNPWADHTWFPTMDTTQQIKVFETGTYRVEATDIYGCFSEDSMNVAVDFVPIVDLGPDTTICLGESILLDAGAGNPGTTYLWNVNGSSTQNLIVSAPAQYIVVVTTAGNCVESDTMTLDVSLAPVVNLGPDRKECFDFELNANNAGSSFLWSNTDTTQIITTNQVGTYWVQVTNIFGCSASDTVIISQGAIPVVNLGPDQIICNGSTVTLSLGNPGQNYFWSTGQVSQTITVSTPGIISGEVENQDGCKARDTVEIILSPLTVELGPNRTICDGDSTKLDAGTTGQTYIWSNGKTDPIIYPTMGGLYAVTVSDTIGCVAKDTVILTAQPDFVPDFSVTDSIELFQMIQFNDLSGGNPNTWLWDFGDGTKSTMQNPTHAFQSVDTFTVCLTASDGVCTNTICKEIPVKIFTNIEEELGLELEIYPNPNNGVFTLDINMPLAREIQASVWDVRGKQIYGNDLGLRNTVSTQIVLDGISEGLYMLKLDIDNKQVFRKLYVR